MLLLLVLLQGYEVIYLTDVLDEYVMQQLPEYEDYKFVNIAKEDIEHLDKVCCRQGGVCGWQHENASGWFVNT